MSAINVEKFFEKVEADKSLAAKLKQAAKLNLASKPKALSAKTISEHKAKLAAEVVQIAAAAGFKFSAKDLVAANAAKIKKLPAGTLPDVTGQDDDGGYRQCDILMFRMRG
jgi:hypothetical protein